MIESIGSIIRNFFQKIHIEPQLRESKLLSNFHRVIDPDLAEEVIPERMEGGILFLRVKSPAGMNELKLRQKSLIKKINDLLGDKSVSEIRVNLGNPTKE